MHNPAMAILILGLVVGCAGAEADPVTIELVGVSVRVPVGGSTTLGATLSGPWIEGDIVEVDGLPTGVTAEGGAIGTDGVAQLTVHAADDATMGGPYEIELVVADVTEPVPLYVAGEPGALDTSFSFDGIATYQVNEDGRYDAPRKLEVDSAGRVLVSGVGQGTDPWRGWLVRFLPEGTIDPSFGGGGEVLLDANDTSISSVVARGDDALVVLALVPGETPGGLAIRGLTEDGAPDPSYAGGGWIDLGTEPHHDLVRRPSGIVVHGTEVMSAYGPSGTRDSAFSADLTGLTATIAVAADDQDRLWLGGYADGDTYVIKRLSPDGGADPQFGSTGQVVIPLPPFFGTDAVVHQIETVDAGAVAAGISNVGNIYENIPVLLRVTEAGTVDPSFGDGGVATVLAEGERGGSSAMAVQADGRFLVAGYRYVDSSVESILRRLNPDGSPDRTFGIDGDVALDDFPFDMAVDDVAGRVLLLAPDSGTNGGVRLIRVWL